MTHRICRRCGGALKVIDILSEGFRIAKCRRCGAIIWIDPPPQLPSPES